MFSDPQFWVLVAFIIFIAAVFLPVRKILTTNLDSKIKEIKDSIDQAEKLKNEAQKTLSELKKRQNEVKQEIELINNETKDKISLIEENASNKLKQQIEKRKLGASVKIDQMKRDANNEIKNYITQTSIATVSELLEEKLSKKDQQNLINDSINELSSSLKN